MSTPYAAATAPFSKARGPSAPTLGAAQARLIVARLPLFAACWIGVGVPWWMFHVSAGRVGLWVALAHSAVMATGFTVAIRVARRHPNGPFGRRATVAACVLAIASASASLAYMGGSGEVLGFSHLLLCLGSSLMFAWGWGPASVLAIGSFIAWWLVGPQLELFLSVEELWVGYVAGSLVSVGLAEMSARSFRSLWDGRQSEQAALAKLEASRDAYRDLAENARDQIWVSDIEGRILYVNEASARFHRVPVSELVGQSMFEMITDHSQNPETLKALRRIVRGETLPPLLFQVAPRAGGADLQWHEVLVSAVYGPDGRVTGLRGISRDASERVHAAEKLRESEERFRGAFAATSVGLTITDTAGRALQLNDAICTMLGYTRDELLTMTIDEVTHPDDRAATNAERHGLLTSTQPSFALEKRFIRRDGQIVWGAISVSPLRDAQGTPVAFIALVQDITERRLADDAVRQSHQEVRESREKLRRLARQQTTIREEERKRLGLDLHDDVCQELVGMSIMVEALRRRLGPISEPDAAEFARIARVANGLGDHLRSVAHELRPVQLGDLGLEGSLRTLGVGLSTDASAIEVLFPTRVPRFDEQAEVDIYRIAQEALTNAIRHAGARHIELMLAVEKEFLRLEVCDDGRGFVLAESGDGFGLFSMEERALALGGRLHVWSVGGEGTTIRLTCPVPTVLGEKVDEDEDLAPTPSAAPMTGR